MTPPVRSWANLNHLDLLALAARRCPLVSFRIIFLFGISYFPLAGASDGPVVIMSQRDERGFARHTARAFPKTTPKPRGHMACGERPPVTSQGTIRITDVMLCKRASPLADKALYRRSPQGNPPLPSPPLHSLEEKNKKTKELLLTRKPPPCPLGRGKSNHTEGIQEC